MKQPDLKGDLAAESLYSFDKEVKTDSKVSSQLDKINFFQRPSIIPGVEYPTTDREENIIDATWNHVEKLARHHWFDTSEDPFLDFMRNKVEEIRKEKIQKGQIEPANKEERELV